MLIILGVIESESPSPETPPQPISGYPKHPQGGFAPSAAPRGPSAQTPIVPRGSSAPSSNYQPRPRHSGGS